MAHMIEVPGEANPLTLQNVFNALVSAAGTTQQQVQTGGQQLQNWEKHEGYYLTLQDAFVDYSLPVEVRYLAIIQLKNGIDKYWRKTATNAIKPEEKQRIKLRALEAGIVEPERHLALHNSLMISKIVRYEFPSDWPDVVTSVIASLRSSVQPGCSPIQLSRTLLILLQIIKELSTGRLQRTRTSLQSVTPEIFHVLGNIYVEKVQQWTNFLENSGDDEAGALEAIEQSLMSLKVLRRLVIAGYEHPNRDGDIQGFWGITQTHFGRFYSLVGGETSGLETQVHSLVEKHLLQLSKLHLEMARAKPASFTLLPGCVELVRSYWGLVMNLGGKYGTPNISSTKIGTDGDAEDEKTLLEKVGLKGLLLLRACMKMAFNPAHTFKYQHAQDKEEKTQAVQIIKSQLLTEDLVVQVMELLVTRFFVFRESDLREWEEEPEEWEKREEEIADAWEFSIRSCSEKLFLDLVINFKELLIPKLLNVFYSYANPENREVLLKDSLYSAVGLASASLEQHLDFNSFLQSTLISEVQIQQQGYNLLRRRIAIILGQWMPVKPTELNRAAVYQIFQHLLNKDDPLNDQVVRVTAGRQLKNVIDPYEFSSEGFLPYAPPILQGIMNLIQEVELPETKMGLLETVRVVVVKMEDHISPFTDQIISLLPLLWDQSGDVHLMKQAILTLLSSLIHSMKGNSVRYHSMILPLIQKSVDPGSETIVYLLEEALELWSAILIQTPSPPSPDILSLAPSLFAVLELGTDSVRQALEIAESYILLAPQEMISDNMRFRLLASLEALLGSTTRQRIGVVPHLAETLIRASETVVGASDQAYQIVAKSLVDSSFLSSLLSGLHDAHQASQSTGPRRKTSPVYGVVETDYFSVLARMALVDPRIFVSAITAAAAPSTEEQTFSWLLAEWFFHFDNIGSVTHKKLHALALTQLLCVNGTSPSSPPPSYVLNNIQSYLTVWTDIVTELSEGSESDPNDPRGGDYLIFWDDANSNQNNGGGAGNADEEAGKYQETEPPETTRRRSWSNMDPVHKINIRHFVREKVQGLVMACRGEERFRDEWLVNVDREVVNAFGALGLM